MASVLVVEDNLDHQRAIAEIVRRLGHHVTVAHDGRAGLAAAAAHRPDLVVADVDMPHVDGLQLSRTLHEDPQLAEIPIVLVTAYLPPSDPQLAAAGAAAVLRKPFSMQELTDALRRHLADPVDAGRPAGGHAAAPWDPAVATADPAFADALLQSLDVGVAACDTRGRLVVVNQMLREFFGDDSPTVPVAQWPERFTLRHHDGTPLGVDELPLVRALAGEHVRHADLLAYDRAGRPRWFDINARSVRDPGGAVLGAVAALHDITTEYRSRHYERCKTTVLKVLAETPDTATAGDRIVRAIGTSLGWPYVRLWLLDEVTDLLRPAATYTAAGEQPLPVPTSATRGHGLAGTCWQSGDLVLVPDIHAPDSPVLPEVSGRTAYRAAGAVPVRSGDHITGVLTFFAHRPQEPESGLAVLLSGIAGNIGAYLEQRRAEKLTLHLAAATDEYLALVGHELRTPLTSIGTYTDLISQSDDSTTIGDVRDLLEVIERNNRRLRQLVEHLLDLAALESGHAALASGQVALAELVGAVVAAHTPAARDRHIEIDVDAPAELTISGDPERLRQVVESLLDNAVKFSPDGATVTVALTADGDAAVLTVTDGGIGVPADEQPHLFRRLFRASNARHTRIPGAGLGLALSRVVIERHHGTITMAGRQPTGTTVTVRLPRATR